MDELTERGVGLKVLTGIDDLTASGKLVFEISAALAAFERELIVERPKAITGQRLYRRVSPAGQLHGGGHKVLAQR